MARTGMIAFGLALLVGDPGLGQGPALYTEGYWAAELSEISSDAGALGEGDVTFVIPGMASMISQRDGQVRFDCWGMHSFLRAWSSPSSTWGMQVRVFVRVDHFDRPGAYEYMQAELAPGGILLEEATTLVLIRKMMAPGAHTMYLRPEAGNGQTVNFPVHKLPARLRAAGFQTWCGFHLH